MPNEITGTIALILAIFLPRAVYVALKMRRR